MISVIWITGLYLIAFAPWLHIPVYVGPLVMYSVLLSLLFLPLPVVRPRSRIWLLKRLVSQSKLIVKWRLLCTCTDGVSMSGHWCCLLKTRPNCTGVNVLSMPSNNLVTFLLDACTTVHSTLAGTKKFKTDFLVRVAVM